MCFSVLMSVYYKERPEYLRLALDSVINQTTPPQEIVLVKDGKLSMTLDETINEYNDRYPGLFTLVSLDKNMGLGIALREGIKVCRYDIIARMDSDDIARSDRFSKQLDVFNENNNIDIVGSSIIEFEDNVNNILAIKKVPINDNEIKKFAKQRNPFNHMTVMYRKKAILKAGNYEPMMLNEDYYLWVKMILNGSKMHNINDNLVYARTGNDMFKRRGGLNYVKYDIVLQKKFLEMGFVNIFVFIKNVLIRSFVRMIPNSLRGYIYINWLRKVN